MFEIVTSTKFLKDLKLLKKCSPKDLQSLQTLVALLAEEGHRGLEKKHKALFLANWSQIAAGSPQ